MTTIRKQAKEAVVRFSARSWAGNRTDADIRLGIKMLRTVLLERQQKRASQRYVAYDPEPEETITPKVRP
jgi:hypothetical protein